MHRLLALAATCFVAALGSQAAAAATLAPPSQPGPPPQADAGFPAPPAPGTVPPAGPVGPSSSIPTHVGGPGLLSGIALLQARQLTLAIVCGTNGRASVTAPAIRKGVLASTSYRCKAGRANPQLSFKARDAGKLAGLRSTLAHVTLGRGAATDEFSLTLEAKPTASSFWSDGGLECSVLGGDQPYLVAPNFTLTPAAIIDVRPWVAFYTAGHGWRWLGTAGLNQSTWLRWTATSTGVMQWRTPTGALNPWTWAPINVQPGQQTYAIGVFEVIYWYHVPRYVWRVTYSHPSSFTLGTYCSYP